MIEITVLSKEEVKSFFPTTNNVDLPGLMLSRLLEEEVIEEFSVGYELHPNLKVEIGI